MGQVYEPEWLFAKKIKKVWDDIFWKFDFDCIKSSLNKKNHIILVQSKTKAYGIVKTSITYHFL